LITANCTVVILKLNKIGNFVHTKLEIKSISLEFAKIHGRSLQYPKFIFRGDDPSPPALGARRQMERMERGGSDGRGREKQNEM